MNKTQKDIIKRLIVENGGTLSSMEAFTLYGITRLAAIIFVLREEGYHIVSIRKERRDSDGKLISWWTEYRLAA